jgi:hypothetical protein
VFDDVSFVIGTIYCSYFYMKKYNFIVQLTSLVSQTVLHYDRQQAHCSLLFQFVESCGPLVLVHCVAVNIIFLIIIIE